MLVFICSHVSCDLCVSPPQMIMMILQREFPLPD